MVENQLPTDTETNVNQLPANMPGKQPNKTKKLVLIIGVILILIISFSVYFLLSKYSLQKKLDGYVYYGNEAYKSSDFDKASSYFKEAARLNPKEAGFFAAAIKSIALKGNQTGQETEAIQEAEPIIKSALASHPDNIEVLLAAGYTYETAGEYDKALEYYEKAVGKDPKSADALFHKGHVLQFLNKPIEALAVYNIAYDVDPSNPQVLMARANFSLAQGNTDEAFQFYKKASEAKDIPDHMKAEALTGASIIRRSQILYMKETIELSRKAVEIDPNYSAGLGAHGYNLSINGNPKEGVEFFRRAIKANPRISGNYSQLGKVYGTAKLYKEAIENHQEAIRRANNDNTILSASLKTITKAKYAYDLARIYSISGGNPDTIILLQQAVLTDAKLKEILRKDYERGVFKELGDNQAFLSLIQV